MRIIYISTSIFRNSSASIRNISLIKGLIEKKCDVEILTVNYLSELEDKFLLGELSKNIKIRKIDIKLFNKCKGIIKNITNKNSKKNRFIKIKDYLKNIVFFPDNLSESIKKSTKLFNKTERFDLIISSSDSKTSHLITKELIDKKLIEGKWIQIWGDPWLDDINLVQKNFINSLRIKRYEKKILESADTIFYTSELTANSIRKKLGIQNISSINRSYLFSCDNKNWKFNENKIVISYTGVLTQRNIFPILNSIKKYNQEFNKNIILNIYGDNEGKEEYKKYKFLTLYKKCDLFKIKSIYNETDALLYIDNKNGSTQIPGKIYDYCGTNKPILALVESKETQYILEKFNRMSIYKNVESEINLEIFINNLKLEEIIEKFSPKNVASDFLKKCNIIGE